MPHLLLRASISFTCVAAGLAIQGCSVRAGSADPLFESLRGKGPVAIAASDSSAPPTKFFQQSWRGSSAIRGIVERYGTPQAISVEREFLQPHRLKLFYTSQGEVYLFDHLEGTWADSGYEPLSSSDKVQQQARGLLGAN